MLKSCKYCGRIHDSKIICEKKPRRYKKKTDVEKFRWTSAWKNKRDEIKRRDNSLCQICIRNIYNPIRELEYDNLSVHHAIPIEADFSKRLDNDNLLTLCARHHEMAECGSIPYEIIKKIIDEQERKD